MNSDNISIRLKLFMEHTGLSSSQFADSCGIPRPSFSQLLSGRNKKISDVIIGQIHSQFPDLSILWLMFGEGEMLNVGNRSDTIADNATVGNNDDMSGTIFDGSLFGDIRENPSDGRETTKYRKESGLEIDKNVASSGMKSKNSDDLENRRLMMEIEKMKKNPRKVSQITIYYDDSTFETFYPR